MTKYSSNSHHQNIQPEPPPWPELGMWQQFCALTDQHEGNSNENHIHLRLESLSTIHKSINLVKFPHFLPKFGKQA